MSFFFKPKSVALTLAMPLLLAVPAQADTPFQSITSPEGIEAWFVEDYTLPMITIGFAFEGGAAQDPDDKIGRANLITALFDEGAGDLDSNAFQIRQDEVGLELRFSASHDSISGYARMLADDQEEASDLMALALNEPRFDQDAIDRMRDQILAGIVSRSQDPSRQAGLLWNEALFGDHPYGNPVEGTVETLPGITAEDLQALHEAVFARGNLKVGIVGALDAESAGLLIDKLFGDLPAEPDLKEIPTAEVRYGEDLSVEYPLPQTFINLAYPGIAETDDDFFAAYVMTEILAGSSLLSNLNVEVREKRGLSYGVSGGLVNLDHAQLLTIGTSTQPDTAGEATEVMMETIGKMAEDGPTPDQLDRIKSYLIGAYPINQLRSSTSIVGAMVGQQLRGLPIDYIDLRVEKIEAVTADAVKAVADRIFSSTPSQMLVGPGAEEEAPAS